MRLLFLPGAGGNDAFWRPLGDQLPAHWDKTYLAWPGLGDNPPDPKVQGYDDLVALAEAQLGGEPVDILAQSMGGAIALAVALRHPDKVRRLVLAATSGGLDVSALGAQDWRPGYRRDFPDAPDWVMSHRPADLYTRLAELRHPTLLIWGDNDPISPLSVGHHLRDHLPNASLMTVSGGEHDLAHRHPDAIAPAVLKHLT